MQRNKKTYIWSQICKTQKFTEPISLHYITTLHLFETYSCHFNLFQHGKYSKEREFENIM